MMELTSGDQKEYYFKCKGVKASNQNKKIITFNNIYNLIEQEYRKNFILDENKIHLEAHTMTIYPNSTNGNIPYGTLCTRYGMKIIQTVFSKRYLPASTDENIYLNSLPILSLYPFGYEYEE